eukprot:COSAG05_NODE_1598_length_4453_cov_5.666514_4_plen_67_part_00
MGERTVVPVVYRNEGQSSTSRILRVGTAVQGLADARKRAHRSGLVQFFAVYQFDRGGILHDDKLIA